MPIKGKCWSCGAEAYLVYKVLRHIETGELRSAGVCPQCAKYFEDKAKILDMEKETTANEPTD